MHAHAQPCLVCATVHHHASLALLPATNHAPLLRPPCRSTTAWPACPTCPPGRTCKSCASSKCGHPTLGQSSRRCWRRPPACAAWPSVFPGLPQRTGLRPRLCGRGRSSEQRCAVGAGGGCLNCPLGASQQTRRASYDARGVHPSGRGVVCDCAALNQPAAGLCFAVLKQLLTLGQGAGMHPNAHRLIHMSLCQPRLAAGAAAGAWVHSGDPGFLVLGRSVSCSRALGVP